MTLLKSASKIVLIVVFVVSSIALFLDKITSENWMVLATMVWTYYFSKRVNKDEKQL